MTDFLKWKGPVVADEQPPFEPTVCAECGVEDDPNNYKAWWVAHDAALDEAARLQTSHDRIAAAAQAHVAAWDDSLISANKTLVALRAALTETPAPEDGGTR